MWMLDAPGNWPDDVGWTSSSVSDQIAVYDGPLGIGRRFSAASSFEPTLICHADSKQEPVAQMPLADSTPSLAPANVMTSSTFLRTSANQRTAQRTCRPPWECP